MRESGTEARAARLAALGEFLEYELDGEVFRFPPEIPLQVALDAPAIIGNQAKIDVWYLDTCAGEGSADRFLAHRDELGRPLSADDLARLMDWVFTQWDVTPGESSSSAGSSETAGPTSSEISPSPASDPATSSSQVMAGSVPFA